MLMRIKICKTINYLFYLKYNINQLGFSLSSFNLTSIGKTRLGEAENGHEL